MGIQTQILDKPRAFLLQVSEAALDFVLPPRCAACGVLTDRHAGLCSDCWSELTFVTQPHCSRCGVPFEFAIPGTTICAGCLQRPPAFDKAFSPLVYEGAARTLILQFKHSDRLGHAKLLGRLMAAQLGQFDMDHPLIMPVPLHHWRLMRRRFNQSALLARTVADVAGADVDVLTLLRTRATPMQKGLSRRQRRDNVKAAFGIAKRRAARVRGRDIVLVDDVFTTGATVEACCKALRKAGARRIGVLTAARVAGPQTAII